jgi:hypothetical protein
LFLHIGQDRLVPLRSVIVILDAGILDESADTRLMVQSLRGRGLANEPPEGEVKSWVLTDGTLYGSPISSITLLRRSRRPGWQTTDADPPDG